MELLYWHLNNIGSVNCPALKGMLHRLYLCLQGFSGNLSTSIGFSIASFRRCRLSPLKSPFFIPFPYLSSPLFKGEMSEGQWGTLPRFSFRTPVWYWTHRKNHFLICFSPFQRGDVRRTEGDACPIQSWSISISNILIPEHQFAIHCIQHNFGILDYLSR